MIKAGPRQIVDLVFSTARPPTQVSGIALAGLRILAGLIWLYNVVWKIPPDFGQNSRSGLFQFTNYAVDYPVLPPFSWLIEHAVLPNFTAFGWLVLVMETVLAVLLLTGTAVRLAALIGVAQSVAIALSVAEAPNEWPWAYAMLIGIHVVLLLTPCGQYAAVDAVHASAAQPSVARRLLCVWGVILAAIGAIALVRSVGDGWLAHSGQLAGYQKLEFSLGNYNLLAAVVLLAVAVLMFAGAFARVRVLPIAAAVIAASAAVSIYVQLGRTDIWLGGTGTTAAVFVSAAVVAAVTQRFLRDPASAGAARIRQPSGTHKLESKGAE